MATVPNGISVSVQYKPLHTILHKISLYKPFIVGLCIGLGICQCDRSLLRVTVGREFRTKGLNFF